MGLDQACDLHEDEGHRVHVARTTKKDLVDCACHPSFATSIRIWTLSVCKRWFIVSGSDRTRQDGEDDPYGSTRVVRPKRLWPPCEKKGPEYAYTFASAHCESLSPLRVTLNFSCLRFLDIRK